MAVELDHPDYVVKAEQLEQFAHSVKNYVDTNVTNLDANVTSNDGTNVQVQVIEENGVITGVHISDNTVNATDVNTAIESALANYGGFKVVELTSGENPVPNVSNPSERFIYLTKDDTTPEPDHYTEWIWIAADPEADPPVVAHWEVIGETTVDLSNYYTTTESDGRYMQVSKLGSHVYTVPSDEPVYNYAVLANFISGHSAGTIIDGAWIETVLSQEDKEAEWIWGDYSPYEADSTVGAKLVDPRAPIDFSDYGVSTGTPYGIISQNLDTSDCRVTYNTTGVSKTSMTAELWAFGCPSDPEYGYWTSGPFPIMTIGATHSLDPWTELFNLVMYVNTASDTEGGVETVRGIHVCIAQGIDYNGEGIVFYLTPEEIGTLFGETIEFSDWLKEWHHYAISVDSSNMYFFIDGKKAGQRALADNVTIESHDAEPVSITHTLGEFLAMTSDALVIEGYNYNQESWDGGIAQVAVCDSCKWTADFEVPTVAY